MGIILRPMTQADCVAGYRLTQQLHWPHRMEDWQEALRLGEGRVAECEGQIVGTALSWRWGAHWATLGLVVVDAKFQGRGIGRRLLEQQIAALGERQLRLHATAAGLPLYQSLGFTAVGETQQFQTACLTTVPRVEETAGQRLRRARAEDLPELTEQDRQANGMVRSTLVSDLFRYAELWVLEEGDRIVGWGASRRFGRGWTLGPVIAHGVPEAQRIIARLMQDRVNDFVRIDTHAAQGLGEWLSRCGLTQVDAPVVMVRGEPWRNGPEEPRAFALMSQAMA
ncbi:GNAT family N-acetyltransferase [Lonsdalea britannica]|uniref:GNAT family N-acetyltransferase n=1 Tax=Lonsdalea britannica TaxID=1082704 RepID=UPI0026F1198B|nr:GNAT family N-acetyltransferase [Lonsdalea britannica]